MAIASFEDLCSAVCELGGAPVPALARDATGCLAVELALGDVRVTLTHEPSRSDSHFFLMAAFGPLPIGNELAACQALMDANAALLAHGGPCFSLHPLTHEVTLQHACPLDQATPHELYGQLQSLAAIARDVRERVFAASGPAGRFATGEIA